MPVLPDFAWVGAKTEAADGDPPLEEMYPPEEILAAAGRIAASRRQNRSGPAKLIPCPACGRSSTARERRRPCLCGHRW